MGWEEEKRKMREGKERNGREDEPSLFKYKLTNHTLMGG